MNKHPLLHFAVAFLLGDILIWVRLPAIAGIVVFAILDLIVISNLSWKSHKKILFFIICFIFFINGALRTCFVENRYRYSQKNIELNRERIEFEGVLYKKEIKNDRLLYYFDHVKMGTKRIEKVICYPWEDIVLTGSKVRIKGKVLDMYEAENEGGFDEHSYYHALGIAAKIEADDIAVVYKPAFSLRENLYKLSKNIRSVYNQYLYGEEAGLLAMMTIGSHESVDTDARDLFSEAGLSHIFAISGLHISLIGMGIFSFFRHRKVSYLKSAVISWVVVILYVLMVGYAVSAIRAAGMFGILLLAKVKGEAYDPLSAVAAMGYIVLMTNPLAVMQMSFVFSFGAIMGIVLIVLPVVSVYHDYCEVKWEQTHRREKGRRWHIRFSERVITAFISGLALQLSTLPLSAYYIYSVPVYVCFLNLILLPFLGILLGTGLIGGLCGCLFPTAGVILIPCHYLLYFYEFLANASTKLPFSTWITGRPPIIIIIIYYILLYLMVRKSRSWVDSIMEKHCAVRDKVSARTVNQVPHIRTAPVVAANICGCVLLVVFLQFRIPTGFETDMLYVGQGDGIFIDSGMGRRYMIDGGSTSEEFLGKYTLLPFLKIRGIRRIDTWFLTHMDEDHISGFLELVDDGYPISELVLAKRVERSEAYRRLTEKCINRGIKIRYMRQGDSIICKSHFIKSKKLQWTCIFPDEDTLFEGANENSLVLLMSYNDEKNSEFNGVFTGDIGEEQELAILHGRYADLLGTLGREHRINILKSSHHGSNGSNCRQWLSVLMPETILISAGKNNRYHHPGVQAVSRMDELGLKHFCTIDYGQIKCGITQNNF